jgi:hypothetical protein
MFHENLGEPLPNPSAHNLQLESFANAIKEIADARGAKWLDLFAWSRDYHKRQGRAPSRTMAFIRLLTVIGRLRSFLSVVWVFSQA